MVSIKCVDISKKFGSTVAVNHVNLDVKNRELVTLLGPSGCGKTTTLRIIAGLCHPDTGDVYFDEMRVTDLPPYKREIGFVFQRIALFPHMNVYDNVAFGLKLRRYPKEEIKRRVEEALSIVRLRGLEKRRIDQLSGGQAQRVEIARVLVTDPKILLFDEPLSNLDAKLRDSLKYEIRRIQRETGKTAIYVTHDQAEAFAISDRIYVMNNGEIEQVGTPTDLYLEPKTNFVADFIGTTNFIEGKVVKADSSGIDVEADNIGVITLPPLPNADEFKGGEEVLVSVRPEDIEVLERGRGPNIFKGVVEEATFLGLTTRLIVSLGDKAIKVDVQGAKRFTYLESKGKNVMVNFKRCTLIKVGS